MVISGRDRYEERNKETHCRWYRDGAQLRRLGKRVGFGKNLCKWGGKDLSLVDTEVIVNRTNSCWPSINFIGDKNKTLKVSAEKITLISNPKAAKAANNESGGLEVEGGKAYLGNDTTQSIDIKVTDGVSENRTYGIGAFKGNKNTAHIWVTTDNLNIDLEGTKNSSVVGLWAQNNDDSVVPEDSKDVTEIIINAQKTKISAKNNNDKGTATGIINYSGARIIINSDLEVTADTAISTRGNAVTKINEDGTHTVKLNGDIVFDITNDGNSGKKADANVNINLNNAESYLNGSVKKTQSGNTAGVNMDVAGMKLNIANDAAWNMTSDSFANDVTVSDGGKINVQEGAKNFTADSIAMNNGNINLQGSGQKAEVKELKGEGGTITTNSLDNKLDIGTKADDAKLKVEGSGEIGDKILAGKATLEDLAGTAKVDGKTASDEVGTQDGIIAGKMFAKVGTDGKIIASTVKRAIQQHNLVVSSMANLSLMTWRQENNDMNKRLGEVRASEGSQGIWARMARGQSKYGSQGIKNQYNYYQLGYDSKISDDWILGGAFTYTDGDSSYTNGSGTNKHTGFAVYGSNLRDDGSFIDLIAKYAHMKNDFDVNGGVGSGDYSTNGLSFSAEYGKRFHQEGYWIEPQAELTYGRVSSADFTTKNGASVHQDSMDSLVGRLGFSLGKDIKQGNVYVRASYLYDFQGDTSVTMSKGGAATPFKTDLGGGWWEFGVGTNLDLGHDTHFYLDVETTAGGDVDTPWQWNAGVRYSF